MTITANDEMQRWVDDAALYPRSIPARLRLLLDGGLAQVAGGTYFSAPSAELAARLPAVELEPFVNQVSIDSLKTVQRLEKGSDPWCYEAVAIAIAFGERVLELAGGFVTVVLDVDEERSSCVLRLTSEAWHPAHPDEVAWLEMTRS